MLGQALVYKNNTSGDRAEQRKRFVYCTLHVIRHVGVGVIFIISVGLNSQFSLLTISIGREYLMGESYDTASD